MSWASQVRPLSDKSAPAKRLLAKLDVVNLTKPTFRMSSRSPPAAEERTAGFPPPQTELRIKSRFPAMGGVGMRVASPLSHCADHSETETLRVGLTAPPFQEVRA
ncbi:hypothetical protein PGT21_036467 [Puccinia graminis f. sp. tritici]|uniref:Uncharacterized protein n=1 Tax=Puccinia graminis f. sp. tritici TaxID=56615 RepID=A0A5B0R308_PUCGR|nr:hypothetical protein PGT21_036467 [Puccinia graminis f. sp. tritici]